jgi:L-2-hydroxyglutarate oxidase LhgO
VQRVDAIVVGAGVIGLAVGRALAQHGREVLLLERADDFGTETSSRNSEVIHAGIYYPRGSLKAQLCVAGKNLLYRHCADYGIPHLRCGKLIVATSDGELPVLHGYQQAALANGVGELTWLDEAEIARLEPAVRCRGGVWSESTGVVDSHAFMTSLLGDLEAGGGTLALQTEVTGGAVEPSGIRIDTAAMSLTADIVVNAAGLKAPELARRIEGGSDATTPAARYAKGHYYVYTGRSPFSRLVYPVAEAGGLGVHVTVDLGGQARFGPDVTWVDTVDYGFDDTRRGDFIEALFPGPG